MLFSTLALTLTLGFPPQDAQAAVPLDLLRAVPKDAWLFAELRDLDALRADLEHNALWLLYQDQESSALRGWFEHALAQGASAAEKGSDPGKLFLDFLGSVHGSMLFYLAAPAQGSEPDLVVVVDPGSPRAGFEKVFDQLAEEEGKDAIKSTRSYAGVELQLFESKPADSSKAQATPAAKPHHLVFLDSGTFAAFTLSTEADRSIELAHATIDRLRGTDAAEGIAASPRYLEARTSVSARGRLELFSDLSLLIPFAMAQQASRSESEDKVLAALGFTDLRWGYLTGDLGPGEQTRIELGMALPEKGLLRGLSDVLGKLPLEAARAFPKESQGVTLYAIDVPGLWKWIWELVKATNPAQADASRAQLQAAGQGLGGIDIEKDVIGQLTGEFGMNVIEVPGEEWLAANGARAESMDEDEPPPEGAQPAQGKDATPPLEAPKGAAFGQAWWIGLRDAKAFVSTFENVLDATGASEQFETEEFQGKTIWSMPLPGTAALALAFTNKGLVLSNCPSALRAVLRMEGKDAQDSVLERGSFKPLFAENGEAGVFSVMQTAGMLKSLVSALSSMSGRFAPLARAGAEPQDNPLLHLPPAETIDKHFPGTATSTLSRHGGVLRMRFSTR